MPRPRDRAASDSEPGQAEDLGIPDWRLPSTVKTVILVDWPASLAAKLGEVFHQALPEASVQKIPKNSLRFSRGLPDDTLLVVPDRLGRESGLGYLGQLRGNGIEAPAIVLGSAPTTLTADLRETLGVFDLMPFEAFSEFALQRSLQYFSGAETYQRLLDEMSSRFQAYERVLESKDEERLRVLKVAGALERRLAETEQELERMDTPAPGLEVDDALRAEEVSDDQTLADLVSGDLDVESSDDSCEVQPPDDWTPGMSALESEAPEAERVPELLAEVRSLREERTRQEADLAELRKHAITREKELRRLVTQSATAGDLAIRLEASERIRRAQTREMLNQQQLIGDLEQKIANLADLLDARRESAETDPGEVLAELKARLARFEKIRQQQQVTINQLSRSLAVQQVDDALDNAQSRRNVLSRVEEAVRRSQRSGTSLTCMMIGIDHPETIRDDHGSVLYDYMLVQVAQRLQFALRHRDVLLRYGDEAFVLLTDTDNEERARPHAERLLKLVSGEPLDLGPKQVVPTVSVAVQRFEPPMRGANELIRVAMKRLISAQKDGTQQVVLGASSAGEDPYAEQTLIVEDLPSSEDLTADGGALSPGTAAGEASALADSEESEEPALWDADHVLWQEESIAIDDDSGELTLEPPQ